MLRSSAVAVQLRRRIIGLQARSDDGDVVFGVGVGRLSCFSSLAPACSTAAGGMRSLFSIFVKGRGSV
jgi:hypothetical protein